MEERWLISGTKGKTLNTRSMMHLPVAPVTTAHFPNFFKSFPGRKKVLYKCETALRAKLRPNNATVAMHAVSKVS